MYLGRNQISVGKNDPKAEQVYRAFGNSNHWSLLRLSDDNVECVMAKDFNSIISLNPTRGDEHTLYEKDEHGQYTNRSQVKVDPIAGDANTFLVTNSTTGETFEYRVRRIDDSLRVMKDSGQVSAAKACAWERFSSALFSQFEMSKQAAMSMTMDELKLLVGHTYDEHYVREDGVIDAKLKLPPIAQSFEMLPSINQNSWLMIPINLGMVSSAKISSASNSFGLFTAPHSSDDLQNKPPSDNASYSGYKPK